MRGYGATVARLTPDQTVGRSNRSGLILYTVLVIKAKKLFRALHFYFLYTTVWPSGLRRQTQVLVERSSWVPTPKKLSFSQFWFSPRSQFRSVLSLMVFFPTAVIFSILVLLPLAV